MIEIARRAQRLNNHACDTRPFGYTNPSLKSLRMFVHSSVRKCYFFVVVHVAWTVFVSSQGE